MKNNPALPGGLSKSKPTWSNAFGCSATSAFLFLATRDKGKSLSQERFLLAKGKPPLIRKGIEMKCFLTLVLIAALGVFTIGCGSQNDTTEKKTETKTTQTKDGKITGETKTSTDTKTTTPPAGGTETEKTTETTK
jgi:hypothetical protein